MVVVVVAASCQGDLLTGEEEGPIDKDDNGMKRKQKAFCFNPGFLQNERNKILYVQNEAQTYRMKTYGWRSEEEVHPLNCHSEIRLQGFYSWRGKEREKRRKERRVLLLLPPLPLEI